MSSNYQDPEQQENHDLYQLKGYRGQENLRQNGKDQFCGAGSKAQHKVNQIIDQLAYKVPGGSQYAQQVKDASATALNHLEDYVQQVKDASATALNHLEEKSEEYAVGLESFFSRLFGGK